MMAGWLYMLDCCSPTVRVLVFVKLIYSHAPPLAHIVGGIGKNVLQLIPRLHNRRQIM